MKCVKVELKQAENVKNKLLKVGLFNKSYSVTKDKDYVYFPVTKKVQGFQIVEKKLEKKITKLTLEDVLKGRLSKREFDSLIKSYDVVGAIAIIEVENSLLDKKKLIADAILNTNKNIKTVVRKLGGHEGEYRVQNYEFLTGEKKFETVHKENGISIKLDINKVYYSPRSSNERLRISNLVKDGEEVLVMFSGVGVFPLVIAKHSKAREIYGVEINPTACKYADENVKLNKFNKIKLFCGDVNRVLPKINKKFDRILMPLPSESKNFLDLALGVLKKNGTIHFYCFSSEEDISNVVNFIKEKCKCNKLAVVKCGQKSPRIYRYCIDFTVS